MGFTSKSVGRDAENTGEVPEKDGGSRAERREWGINGPPPPLLRQEGGKSWLVALRSAGLNRQNGKGAWWQFAGFL